jgi:hypothetical protein
MSCNLPLVVYEWSLWTCLSLDLEAKSQQLTKSKNKVTQRKKTFPNGRYFASRRCMIFLGHESPNCSSDGQGLLAKKFGQILFCTGLAQIHSLPSPSYIIVLFSMCDVFLVQKCSRVYFTLSPLPNAGILPRPPSPGPLVSLAWVRQGTRRRKMQVSASCHPHPYLLSLSGS